MTVQCATLEVTPWHLAFYVQNSIGHTKNSYSFDLKRFFEQLEDAISHRLPAVDITLASMLEKPLCVWNFSKFLPDSDLRDSSGLTNATVGYNTDKKKCFFHLYRNNILDEDDFKIVENNRAFILTISLFVCHVVQHGFLLNSVKFEDGCFLIFFHKGILEIEP